MRRSREITLTLLAAAALATVGCNDDSDAPRHCVDAQNRLLPDSACNASPMSGVHYMYGGSSGGHIGDTLVGGSTSSVSRGGFGHGGGEGGGE